MRILLILILGVFVRYSYAQQHRVTGTVKTDSGAAVPFAGITLNDSLNRIVAFQPSDEAGTFSLMIPKGVKLEELTLEINHLGFKRIRQKLIVGKINYDILMQEKPIDLSEVQVKSRPRISSIGDTLSYDVGSFAKNEDRSIGDVIKRLPGMEVSESGQIKFNGQNISNLYIDGDDLLDDKYAIGTKTIPYAMVKGVEVLQHHQPLKVLRNKDFSNKIAINLVIKEEAKLKLSGQIRLGAGLPEQYDGEFDAIHFNKKYKMLNVVKSNNIGNDLSSDFEGFDRSSFMTQMGNSRPSALLFSGTSGAPNLAKSRYYLNNSGSVNANNLMNYKSGFQLKSNIKMLVDYNEMSYANITELYSAVDTIQYREQQRSDNHPFITDVNFNIQSNKEVYFFRNNLKFVYSKETGYSSLLSNDMDMHQRLNHLIRDFSNNLEYVPELKNKNIININWYINYFNQPQTLVIQPGINASTFNEGNPFEGLNQFAETPTWFNRASLGYRLTKGIIKQRYQAGILNEFQKLNSRLRLDQANGSQTPYYASHDNRLHWNRNQFFVNGTYEYKKGALESVLEVPVTLQRIAYKDKGYNLDESKTRLLLNPALSMKYSTNAEDDLSFNYNFKNEVGNINGVYRGAVLGNYRSLSANDAALEERYSHNLDLRYHSRHSIIMLFMNAGIGYKSMNASTIASTVVSNNISQTVLLPFINNTNSFNVHAGISKYIFLLGATANLNASWETTRFNQLFNSKPFLFNNVFFVLTPSIEARLLNRISLNYSSTASWVTSKSVVEESKGSLPDRQIHSLNQSIGLTYSPVRNAFIRVNGMYRFSKQSQIRNVQYFFVDVHVTYKLTNWHTEIQLNLTNLSNITSYETYSISANRFEYNQYQLRGRMGMLNFIFNL